MAIHKKIKTNDHHLDLSCFLRKVVTNMYEIDRRLG
jgi:hypothetical protein